MKKMKFLMPLGFLLIIAGFSVVVMLLWNWLMPSIFGLVTIDFWQSVGLLALCRILLGSFAGRRGMGIMRGRMHSCNRIHEKWSKMTPQEREEFINKRKKHSFFEGHPFGFSDNSNMHKDNE